MTEQDIEDFIRYYDQKTRGMCVNPDCMTFDCCDCYLCRVAFFNQVRRDLKEMKL
ncbi:hypothetical protein NE454_19355 [Blautia producta]|uniref:hypothetical protein n=1 Tax=Blautia producta TaxID=33035 RepID=UPI00210B9DA1|nr:hypothetical protein [Blautia producta]MCQ5126567.1 hypothetical protein [Blautia producta]